ncbi:MAG: alpha/beta fold hydrolase, partial [Litorimonas sp.]
ADPARVSDAMVSRYRDMMRQPGNGAAFTARAEQFTLPDPAPGLASIDVPTVVLWGAQDAVLPVDHADRFAEALPDARVERLDGVGHLPQLEAPERVVAAVREVADRAVSGSAP